MSENSNDHRLLPCPIWGTTASKVDCDPENGHGILYDSPRAGGKFLLSSHGDPLSMLKEVDASAKARLTSWLIEKRQLGNRCPEITEKVIEVVKQREQMPIRDRADSILIHINSKTDQSGQYIEYGYDSSEDRNNQTIKDLYVTPITQEQDRNYYELLAYSECTSQEDLEFPIEYLKKHEWIEKRLNCSPHIILRLTLEGKLRLEEINKPKIGSQKVTLEEVSRDQKDSSRGFMAMWFDPSMDQVWEEGFEPGIREAGYDPVRIDKKDHPNRIDEEIINEISKARFIVADLTHGDKGVRGGVYYEAGFAHGRDIRVIFTCHEDCFDKVHFDIRQYYCIKWKDHDKLRKELTKRITGIVGRGPGRSAN